MFVTRDYSMLHNAQGPYHTNQCYSGQTTKWSGTDNYETFIKNCKDTERYQQLESFGWLDPSCITYQYNAHGFRAPEIDHRLSGLALGCSHTEGVGIPVNKTWVAQLTDSLGIHIWNFGVGGSSKDTAFRLLDHYINILNLKFVILCGPTKYRFEIKRDISEFSTISVHTQIPHLMPWINEWFLHDENSDFNNKRNSLAMQKLCEQHLIPFFYIDIDILGTLIFDGQARDFEHPGVHAHKQLAENISQLLQGKI
jgi:hypothetical protein